jgi:uncharacterized protein with GYD domain
MPRFLTLINFTEQGMKNFKDTTKRADAFVKKAKEAGVTVNTVLWTVGAYDGAVLFDAPDEQTAAGLMVSLAAQGNVRTQTLRAFDREEIAGVVSKSK